MTRTEKAYFIGAKLDELYPDPKPFLHFQDPFTLLVAVMLSAQCTDAKVNKVTPELFRLAGTPQAMASLGSERVFEVIRSLGLANTKSKNLCRMSEMLIEKFAGKVPDNFEDLESLPGVGHKTASVVMSHAFGKPAFPVDTHIFRLASRWGLTDGKTVEKTEADLKVLFPSNEWERRHLQLIAFGREYCTARHHDASLCPICSVCSAEEK